MVGRASSRRGCADELAGRRSGVLNARAKHAATRILRPLFSILLLAIVAYKVPWSDQLVYGEHPLEVTIAIVLSTFNHMGIAGAIFALGDAFGASLSPLEYLGLTAIANVISSLPLAPGGWGVGEVAFGYLFHLLGLPATLGVAVSVTYRLLTMALGVVGGVFLLLPGGKEVRHELEVEKSSG